jgi:hypothetical protein
MSGSDRRDEIITAKWKTKFDAEESYFGTIELGDDYRIDLPLLDSEKDIPVTTTVLWGRTEDLKRCTAVTLPFGEGRSCTHNGESSFGAQGNVLRLMIGRSYIADPAAAIVSEISFVPRPSGPLHTLHLQEAIFPKRDIASITFSESCTAERKAFATSTVAFFEPQRGPIFDSEFRAGEIKLRAGIGGSSSREFNASTVRSHLIFTIRFKTPRDLESALDETNELCVFLSMLAHQYIYPADFTVVVAGEEQPFRVMCRGFRVPAPVRDNWVGHTLIVPDQSPDKFCQVLAQWYASNDQALRSRYLYRYSLEEPNNFSTWRFLAIFQAFESRISKSNNRLLSEEQFDAAEGALRNALPGAPTIEKLIGKLRSSNSEPLPVILTNELPKIFSSARIRPDFDIPEFVRRICLRRNKSSHGGPRLTHEPIEPLLIDTLLLNAIHLMIECRELGLEPGESVSKLMNALRYQLPLKIAY